MNNQDLNKLNKQRGNLTLPEAKFFNQDGLISIVKIRIKPSHSDSYRHTNSSCYVSYFEVGRRALQILWNICEDNLLEKGILTITCSWTLDFKKETKPNDLIKIVSYMQPYERGVCFKMEHKMFLEKNLVAKAQSKHLFQYKEGRILRPNSSEVVYFFDRLKNI